MEVGGRSQLQYQQPHQLEFLLGGAAGHQAADLQPRRGGTGHQAARPPVCRHRCLADTAVSVSLQNFLFMKYIRFTVVLNQCISASLFSIHYSAILFCLRYRSLCNLIIASLTSENNLAISCDDRSPTAGVMLSREPGAPVPPGPPGSSLSSYYTRPTCAAPSGRDNFLNPFHQAFILEVLEYLFCNWCVLALGVTNLMNNPKIAIDIILACYGTIR